MGVLLGESKMQSYYLSNPVRVTCLSFSWSFLETQSFSSMASVSLKAKAGLGPKVSQAKVFGDHQ